MNVKKQLVSAIFVPTLCYESQTWALNARHVRRITTCEMKCLRKAANKTRRDRIRNEDVRKSVGLKPVIDFIDRQRVKWFGHLVRMPPNQPALRAYMRGGNGVRSRGRPRNRWIDNVNSIFRDNGLTPFQATQLAKERKLYLPATLKRQKRS